MIGPRIQKDLVYFFDLLRGTQHRIQITELIPYWRNWNRMQWNEMHRIVR